MLTVTLWGKRSQGGQKKRHKDCLKASLKSFDIDDETRVTLALEPTCLA